MALELVVAGETYEVETHNSGYGGPSYAAVNVKYRGSMRKLPQKYQQKLVRLVEKKELSESDLDSLVFETIAEQWWEWARDRADELGLGRIFSAGRCGGWLILDRWPESHLRALEGDSVCENCGLELYEHAAGKKCLYEPTWYKPIEDGDLEQLQTILAFLKECHESVKTFVPEQMRDEYKYRIDEAWTDYRAKEKSRVRALDQP